MTTYGGLKMYYKITSELYDDDGTLLSQSENRADGLPNAKVFQSMDEFLLTFDVFERKGLELDAKVREQMQRDYTGELLKKLAWKGNRARSVR